MHPYDKEYLRLHELHSKDIKGLVNRLKEGVINQEYFINAIDDEVTNFQKVLENLMDRYEEDA